MSSYSFGCCCDDKVAGNIAASLRSSSMMTIVAVNRTNGSDRSAVNRTSGSDKSAGNRTSGSDRSAVNSSSEKHEMLLFMLSLLTQKQ